MNKKFTHVIKTFFSMIGMGMPRWITCLFGCVLLGVGGYVFNLGQGLLLSYSVEKIQLSESATRNLLFIALCMFLASIILGVGYIINVGGAMSIRAKIQGRLISRWLGQSERWGSKHHSGEAISLVTNDMEIIEDFYFQGLTHALMIPVFQGLPSVITIAVVDWRLLIAPLITGAISLYVTLHFSDRVQSETRGVRENSDKLTRLLSELLGGNVTHRMLGTTDSALEGYTEFCTTYADSYAHAENIKTNTMYIGKLLDAISMAGFLGTSIWLVSVGKLNFTNVLMLISLQTLVGEMMKGLGTGWNYIVTSVSAGERIINALKIPQEDSGEGEIKLQQSSKDLVRLENVSFSYDEDKKVLDNVSFSIKEGQTLALVGPSGSGKSTIFQLLLRFYDPDSGKVIFGNTASTECSLDSWREQIVYIQQEAPILTKTVKENIGIGLYGSGKTPTDEEIENAAKAAGAHNFIKKLPNGYDTLLEEKGSNLSGGQRQLIAIARAFLSGAPIVLLDEPTSALDAESERVVQKSLDLLMQERTVLTIAHRIDTIRNADLILVLENGRIIQRGSHEELIKLDGVYTKLYKMQEEAILAP